jgi:hypothetical protein
MTHEWGRRGMHVGYWWENQKERDHFEDKDVDGWSNIKINLREIGWDGMDWIDLVQDKDQWRAFVNTVMNIWDLLKAGKFLSGCTIGSFSRSAQLRK